MIDPALYLLAGAGAGAYFWAKKGPVRREHFPLNLPIDDPIPAHEGVFTIGRYLPDTVGEECRWSPWDLGEQHLAIFGTTGSGKTVLARLLAITAAELWGWEVWVADFVKGGLDFRFIRDAGIGKVVTKGAIPTMLDEMAKEIERRGNLLDATRVGRVDAATGVEYAVPPESLRFMRPDERRKAGLRPILVILDELAVGLSNERKDEISGPLFQAAATGRFAAVHFVALMQRGDADLLEGKTANLFRARVLAGSTDQVAESMAHGASTMNVWKEMMAAAGYEPDGMERALRPPGRAFVSGLSARPPGLVQLYRVNSLTRSMTMDEWKRTGAAEPPDEPEPPDAGPPSSDPGPSPSTSPAPLRAVPDSVRPAGYAPRGPGSDHAFRPRIVSSRRD